MFKFIIIEPFDLFGWGFGIGAVLDVTTTTHIIVALLFVPITVILKFYKDSLTSFKAFATAVIFVELWQGRAFIWNTGNFFDFVELGYQIIISYIIYKVMSKNE